MFVRSLVWKIPLVGIYPVYIRRTYVCSVMGVENTIGWDIPCIHKTHQCSVIYARTKHHLVEYDNIRFEFSGY